METATEGVVAADQEGCVAYANPAAEKMFGWPCDELVGKSLTELMPERFQQTHAQGLQQYLTSGVARMVGRTVEVMGRRRDGSEFPIDLSLGTWTSDGKTHFAGIMRDVTERKKVEAQLLVADRMVAVGTLSAGVAHEINNPLAAIIGNVDLAMRDLSDLLDDHGELQGLLRIQEELVDARDAADRVRKIVRDLRVFSRGEDEQPGPVDVEHVMESTLRMAWNEIRHRARLVKQYARVPPVEASEARLGQVFLNLIMNAAQAMTEDRAASNEIRISTAIQGERVIVEVSDTGSGIPPEVMKRLFTPFVTSFGGDISVDSKLGVGTRFRIALPFAREPLSAGVRSAPASSSARRRGRILVVDDEPLVAKVVSRSLAADHEVIGLERSAEALALVRGGERFDVILCDLMMPEMTGMELYTELGKLAPEQRDQVVFVTGGAFTPRAREFLERVPNARVEKPIDFQNLRLLLRSLKR
jgi:PAS domain S-box-containing protein